MSGDTWETPLKDLPYPATTDPKLLFDQIDGKKAVDGLTVIFSTYQSIQVVSDAQKLGLGTFGLVVCDEAHRTTGAKESSAQADDISQFVKVHDNSIVSAKKRLHMTATPRIFGDKVKTMAKADDCVVASDYAMCVSYVCVKRLLQSAKAGCVGLRPLLHGSWAFIPRLPPGPSRRSRAARRYRS